MATLDGDGWLDDSVIEVFCLTLATASDATGGSFSVFQRDVMLVHPGPPELRSQMSAIQAQAHVPNVCYG